MTELTSQYKTILLELIRKRLPVAQVYLLVQGQKKRIKVVQIVNMTEISTGFKK